MSNADVAQLVERNLPKVDVEGSSPFIRSNLKASNANREIWERRRMSVVEAARQIVGARRNKWQSNPAQKK